MTTTNIGLHFSVKLTNNYNQAYSLLTKLFQDFKLEGNNVTIHHCFLDEETLKEKTGGSTPVYDLMRQFTSNLVCYNQSGNLAEDRKNMFSRLKDLDATSYFILPLVDGTQIEYNIALEEGVRIQPVEFE